MSKKITAKKFIANVVFAVAAQVISLSISFITILIVPKFIEPLQYSYWQSYVLYVGYVGILNFGLLHGLLLRYAKYDYDELDKARIRSQLYVMLALTSAAAVAACFVFGFVMDGDYKTVAILVAIGAVTKNIVTYSDYMFQITNRISKYAIEAIIQRGVYGVIVVILLCLRVQDFVWFCAADLCGDAVAIIFGMIFNRGLFFGAPIKLKAAFVELKTNVSAGAILLLAALSSTFIAGSAKMIIQWRWGELLFGQVSFAFSLSNIALTFVQAVSTVLFPSLKRVEEQRLPEIYSGVRNAISPLLVVAMNCYFIGCWILKMWLPKYSDSLVYLGILLPLIIYSSKVNLLTNNYLKVYRKEKTMLIVNVASIVLGVIAFALCAYVFNNLMALLICIIAVIMFNSIVSEICVMRIIKVKIIKEHIYESIMTVAFILCASLLKLWVGLAVYAGACAIYLLLNYKTVASLIKSIFKRGKKAEPAGAEDTLPAAPADSPGSPDQSPPQNPAP